MSAGDGRRLGLWLVGHAHIDAVWLWTLEETRGVLREALDLARLADNNFAARLRLLPWIVHHLARRQLPILYAPQRVGKTRTLEALTEGWPHSSHVGPVGGRD